MNGENQRYYRQPSNRNMSKVAHIEPKDSYISKRTSFPEHIIQNGFIRSSSPITAEGKKRYW